MTEHTALARARPSFLFAAAANTALDTFNGTVMNAFAVGLDTVPRASTTPAGDFTVIVHERTCPDSTEHVATVAEVEEITNRDGDTVSFPTGARDPTAPGLFEPKKFPSPAYVATTVDDPNGNDTGTLTCPCESTGPDPAG